MESASSTYIQKRQWVLLLGLAIILSIASFLAPSRLTEYPFSESYEFIKQGDFTDYLSIYSLLLIPIIVIMIATNYLKQANILISLYIACQLDHNRSISKMVSYDLEVFESIWFLAGVFTFIILYKDFRQHFLNHWVRLALVLFAALFTCANIFLALHPALQFGAFGVITMLVLTLMLFSISDTLKAKIYWPLLILLAGIAFYKITGDLNCNVEFFGDMGIANNNPSHILKSCSTYYVWLAIGFILPISIRKKINQRRTSE